MPYIIYPEYLIHWSISNMHTVHLITLSHFLEEETIQVSIIRVKEDWDQNHSFLIISPLTNQTLLTTRWHAQEHCSHSSFWMGREKPGPSNKSELRDSNMIYIKAVSLEDDANISMMLQLIKGVLEFLSERAQRASLKSKS